MAQEQHNPDLETLEEFEARLRRRRPFYKTKRFWLVSAGVHVAGILTLILIPSTREWIFGSPDMAVEKTDARSSEIQRAMDQMLELQRKRLADAIELAADGRDKLDQYQRAKLDAMRAEDADRKAAIAEGRWPTAENPDVRAKFVARVDVDPPPVELPPLPSADQMKAMDVIALYRLVLDLEHQAGRAFERFRALELAEPVTDTVPLSQTLKVTTLVFPERREPVPERLGRDIDTILDGRWDAYKRELNDMYLESENVVSTIQRWVDIVAGRVSGPMGSFGQQYDIVPKPVPYFGHYLNPKYLKRTDLASVIRPETVLGNQIAKEKEGLSGEWMSLDRWYVVGPFRHPGQERRLSDLERKFPPEANLTNVDLNAQYQGMGKSGQTLRWKYRRMGSEFLEGGIRVEPYTIDNDKYAIWYFYTEVYCEKPKRVLASFASDDYGVCWINGERVYASPPETQPWVPFTAQSFRVVELKEGINPVMFKLENALGTTGFSVILMTYNDPDLTSAVEQR